MNKSKIVPLEIFNQVNEAISFYPELTNTEIKFVFANIKTTMAARPNVLSLLFNKRKYNIFINNMKSNKFGILFNDVPEKAQIGLIAHELAHILDYEHKSLMKIIKTGILYLSRKHRSKYEKETDIETIKHGAGWHLFEYTLFILNSKIVSDKYRLFIKRYYLQPDEIKSLIDQHIY
ncbi:MAG: hypothetical protein WCK02_12375 [Bacteroidota bacterium]